MNNVSSLELLNNCTGCCACLNICPKGAITIIKNERGFYNPSVSENCIDCGLCNSVCQITDRPQANKIKFVVAGKSNNLNIRMKSSSGGLFFEVCNFLNEKYNGNISFWGAAWAKDHYSLSHEKRSFETIQDLHGSKYVQSFIGYAFSEIANLLQQGQYVLFSGTGCQCAGLVKYLKAKNVLYDKLFIIDVICHGVPSQQLWEDYIRLIEKKNKAKIVKYSFRDKNVSWHGIHPLVITDSHQTIFPDKLVCSYGKLFANTSLNEKCYECDYTNTNRIGDITLGDFWGIETTHKYLDDGKGVSICLVNTHKGESIISELTKYVNIVNVNDDTFLQPNLQHPTKRNLRQKKFWNDYMKHGYLYVAKKYTMHSKISSMLYKVYKSIKR